ncbi:MAG: OmpA family protein [Bacteroidales bacterium]|nr:OmpA family protein [Bacteroidales bacterium]
MQLRTRHFVVCLLLIVFLFGKLYSQTGTKITQTSIVEAKLNSVLHINCNGDKKGAINIMVSGGIPPYSYLWSNGAVTQDIAGLAAGKYTVIVRDSYGCPDTLVVDVKEPPKLSVVVDSVRDILCYGYKHGRVDVSVVGGVPPYVYSWSNESTAQDLINVEAGEYALLVTDAKNCQEIASALVKQNPLIVKSNEKVQNVSCSGDSTGVIDINVVGGVPPYSYTWTSGKTSEDLNGLVAGEYTVMVRDNRGCYESYSTKVSEPDPIVIKLDEVRHINCSGDKSGAINVDVSGGLKPYIYKWNESFATTQDLAGLDAGEYKLVVEDGKKCTKTLKQTINEPEKLVINVEKVKNVLTYGGSDGAIYINVTGGISPYDFNWSNGAKSKDIANVNANNYICRITDKNKCVNTLSVNISQPALLEASISLVENIKCFGDKKGAISVNVKGGVTPYKFKWSNGDSTQNIKNIPAGTYSLLITDANGITKTLKATVEQPTKLISSLQSVANVACYGDFEGIVDINVNGGTPPYIYNWSNGAKTQDLSKVLAGSYSVKIIDKNNCTDSLKAKVEQSPKLEVSAKEVVDIKCFGKAEGSVSIIVSGGVAPYLFNWSNGAKLQNLSQLNAGQYSLKVSDTKGCTQSVDVRIKEPALMVSSITEVVNVKCKGDSTGAVKINVVGGTAPYAFKWSNAKTEKDNVLLKAGSYSVNITDANGCLNTLSTTVIEPSKLTSIIAKVTNIDCFGESTGGVDVTIGGGVSPYIYKWSNNATTQNLVGVKQGEYSLLVKDQNNCTSELKASIIQNKELLSTVEALTHVACNGDKTGAAKLSVKGGVEPYVFKWSNGGTMRDLAAVKAGQYYLVITDAKGCNTNVNVTLNEPPLFEGEFATIKQISCHGDADGEVITNFKGGVVPYTYSWSNLQTTKDIKTLIAGTYSVTATDKNGCKKSLSTTIEQPTKLELNLISTTNNLCAGERNGAIDISVKGGVTPYTYQWTNNAITQDLSGLAAGKYAVTVTGASGCNRSLEASITEPGLLEIAVKSSTDILCFGGNNGAISLNVKGGKAPYAFSWSNGAITQDILTLVAGSYTVNVKDANACTNSISKNINQPKPLVASIADVKDIACSGDSTGAVSIDVTGGTTPYSFKWSNGRTTEDIDGLKIGDYSVEVKDANGCTQTLKASIKQPPLLVSKLVAVKDVICNGEKEGSIDISVSGGVTPYLYTWSNGIKEQDLSLIKAGKYSVKIQDANGCIRNINAEVKEPEMLVVSIATIKDIKINGRNDGDVTISVSGGVSPYAFSWSNGAVTQNISTLVAGNYSVIVLDKNACRQDLNVSVKQPEAIVVKVDTINHIKCYNENTGYVKVTATGGVEPYTFTWSNGLSGRTLNSVKAGDYTLVVTDANGAKKEELIKIIQPDLFDVRISSANNPTCFELNNGSVATEIRGGTSPYYFLWSNGITTQDVKGLTSGKYAIKVTDARGCMKSDSVELTKPQPLVVNLLNTQHVKCNGEPKGAVNISVSGGVPPYDYNWSHGSKDKNLAGIYAGNYSVNVVDSNNCQKTISTTVNEPTELVARIAIVKDVPCQGQSQGFITTSVTGGTLPYRYVWNTGDSVANISNLKIGDYAVTISDANNCVNKLSAKIIEPVKLTAFVNNVTNISCFGEKEGAIDIAVKGGVAPYKFYWNNGKSDQSLSKIGAGDYNVKITDANGCELTLETKVTEPKQLLAELTELKNIKCFGEKTGSINVTISGGVEPYVYSWSNGAITQDLMQILAGSYTLKVSDSKGCSNILNASVEEPLPLVIETVSTTNIKCNGGKEGEVTIAIKGGVAPYVYTWNNGLQSKDLQSIAAGKYELKVADANGCIKTSLADVVEPPLLKFSIDAVKHISCTGESNGAVNISVSGGTMPYTYQWSNGMTTQDLLNVPAGKYSVIIHEGNGCESTLEVTITEPEKFVVGLTSVAHNKCYGDKNGDIQITATGGTVPYVFNWSNGAKTQNLSSIGAADYSVLVSDANGCNHTIKTTIEQPENLVLTVDSARNVKCCGDTSGAIFISVKGGVGPYQYLWSHGKTSQDVTGLVEGQYTVTVTDANGCKINTPEEGATIYEKIIAQGKFITRDILFDIGKATIKEKSFIEISRIASFMKEHPEIRFSIEGHTDNQGDDLANMTLSKQRSAAIKESLIKFGITASRLETAGKGETVPVDSNLTPEGRANNRRVEFIPL